MPADLPPTRLVPDRAGAVWLGGADRLAFLERLSTNRLVDLALDAGRATLLLDDSGRVVDLLACFAGADGALLVTTAPAAAPEVAARLSRHVLFRDDVRVTDASAQVAVLSLIGPGAARAAARCLGEGPAGEGEGGVGDGAPAGEAQTPGWGALAPGRWRRAGRGDDLVWVLDHVDPGGLGGADLVVPRGALARWRAALLDEGAVAADDEGHDLARIARGLPRFGAELGGTANPLELGLRALVDFGKGCYLGQEIVARLDTYDKVQRRLVRVVADEPLRAGDLVADDAGRFAGPRAGRVTTAARDGEVWRGLAIVGRAVIERGELSGRHADGSGFRARIAGIVGAA